VLSSSFSVLATNALATALLTPFTGTQNMLRVLFHDPEARVVFTEWDDLTRATVSALRLHAVVWPGDRAVTSLVVGTAEPGSPSADAHALHGAEADRVRRG
jgi:hypothetical protein